MNGAVYYATRMCNTMMRRFRAAELPPVKKFHYHQGVFLSGMLHTYKVCGNEKYLKYTKQWVDSIVYEDGSIHSFDKRMLDDIQPGILLIELYKRTGEERYKTALDILMDVVRDWPRNPVGGFWHKEFLKNEMWLDGLYMAGPLEAAYSAEFGDAAFAETAVEQVLLMKEYMQDEKTKLLYHAWDYYGHALWANSETGLSPEVWGRALGWYVVAVLDILELLPINHPKRPVLIDIERELITAVVNYQDERTGMWYQVVDKGDRADNWLESSCSALFVYAIAKAVKMEIAGSVYLDAARRGFQGIIDHSVKFEGEDLLLGDICIGTNACSYNDYIARPTSINDLHGAGAFLLMCAEFAEIDLLQNGDDRI